MNRFREILEDARKRAVDSRGLPGDLVLPETDVNAEISGLSKARHMRLPYSSEPEPIEPAWK